MLKPISKEAARKNARDKRYRENFARIFGKRKKLSPGVHTFACRDGAIVEVGRGAVKKHDNGTMVSMALGCPNLEQQAERLAMYSAAGVEGRFHPATGEFIFEGGFNAQKKAARLHDLEVG